MIKTWITKLLDIIDRLVGEPPDYGKPKRKSKRLGKRK